MADTGKDGSLKPPGCDPIKHPGSPEEIRAMLAEWLADTSGYDEQVWPELKAALERNRTNCRALFDH